MHRLMLGLSAALLVAACSDTQQTNALKTPAGQLFCRIGGGGVVAVANAAANAFAGQAAPAAVIATGASKAYVDAACAKAAPGAVPTVPPADPDSATRVIISMPGA